MSDYEPTIDGIDELTAKFEELGNVSQSLITKAAKSGASMAMNYALANLVPINQQGVDFLGRYGRTEQHISGTLKKAMALKIEKTPQGKTVYRIKTTWYARFFDLGFTSYKGPRRVIPRKGTAEREVGIANGSLTEREGTHFLQKALPEHFEEIKQTMLGEIGSGLNKAIASMTVGGD
ncbi:hypothetical protein SBF1_50006 [Candidatus Desulfosporosinus infrequens]|uniref:Uncharacterized protein n=1 Tax=Candidatus Desulfosporosinus infrequens TaxID=2043169 RepID=A0A2U3LGW7_9FIRM|nr:hypothetical protein SBF1_50006 [Candidatus Desulfosporosinus infrequens]